MVCGCLPALASESIDVSHFETSSGIGMLIFIHQGHPCNAVPAPALHDPRNPVSVVGNEPRPYSPVDVSLPCQHSAPGLGVQKFGPWAHQQGTIVNGPGQALEMLGVLGVKEG